MADFSQAIQAALGMQQNAQTSLPVLPNNGNPMGANNMPGALSPQGAPSPVAANAVNHYPWLAPSPSMDVIHQMLQNPFQNTVHPIMAGGGGMGVPNNVPPMQQVPGVNTGVVPPVMPYMGAGGGMGMGQFNRSGSSPIMPFSQYGIR